MRQSAAPRLRSHTLPRALAPLAAALAAAAAVASCTDAVTAPHPAAAPSALRRDLGLAAGGTYYLHSACGGRVLDVAGVSKDDGARVHLWDKWGGANQQWTLTPVGDGSYTLTSVNSGRVLDVFGLRTTNGSAVGQWTANGGANQHWKVTDLGNGYAKLNPMHAPGMALDDSARGTANGNTVWLWTDSGTCSQQWQFEAVGAGSPAPTRVVLGVYVGNEAADVQKFEGWLGQPVDAVLGYTGSRSWSDADPGWQISTQEYLGATGRKILWSIPMTPDSSGVAGFREVATGARNDLYKSWAQKILASRQGDAGDIYVRTTWEVGGEWFAWTQAAAQDTAAYKAAWQQFAQSFHAVSPRFKMVWDFTSDRGAVEGFYPGDAAVDVVSQDVYWKPEYMGTDPDAAFGAARTRSHGLDWMATFAAAHGKPMAISEWGVPGSAGNTANGARFIDLMTAWIGGHGVLYATYWNSTAAYDGLLSDNDPPATAAELKSVYQKGVSR